MKETNQKTKTTQKPPIALSRRSLLEIGVAAAVISTAGKRLPFIDNQNSTDELQQLAFALRDKPGVELIAHHYLKKFPLHNKGQIYTLLKSSTMTDSQYDQIANLIKSDLENDRTMFIDGWLVAETEARLCAFSHLS